MHTTLEQIVVFSELLNNCRQHIAEDNTVNVYANKQNLKRRHAVIHPPSETEIHISMYCYVKEVRFLINKRLSKLYLKLLNFRHCYFIHNNSNISVEFLILLNGEHC